MARESDHGRTLVMNEEIDDTAVAKSNPALATGVSSGGQPAARALVPAAGSLPAGGTGHVARVDARDPLIGQLLDGRYLVERLLGEGGMGVVYLARHKVIDKRVAVKVLRGEMAADREMAERFLNEARAASSIGNPHIVDISDFGITTDGATYFVMEFLDGKSLAALMNELGVVPVPRIVHLAKQVARGLAAAHRAGIVHRDLKPDNVMILARDDTDFAKVLDFGIAKVSKESLRLTQKGTVFGTPHYMSPEQAAGVVVDHRTDIYSLGVILYELASGKVPFDADNFMGILTQHMYKAPVPFRAIVPQPQDVPPGLEAIVLKCLSKKRELRYQNMDELVSDLEKVEVGGMPLAVTEMMARSGGFQVPVDYFHRPAVRPETPPTRRKPWGLFAGAAGIGLALTVVVGIFAFSDTANGKDAGAAAGTAPPSSAPSAALSPPRVEAPKVTLLFEPLDAQATEDGRPLGRAPVLLEVPAGGKRVVQLAAPGYRTKTVTLDGSDDRVEVRLERAPTAPAKPTAAPRPTAPPSATAKPPTTCAPGEVLLFGKCERI